MSLGSKMLEDASASQRSFGSASSYVISSLRYSIPPVVHDRGTMCMYPILSTISAILVAILKCPCMLVYNRCLCLQLLTLYFYHPISPFRCPCAIKGYLKSHEYSMILTSQTNFPLLCPSFQTKTLLNPPGGTYMPVMGHLPFLFIFFSVPSVLFSVS